MLEAGESECSAVQDILCDLGQRLTGDSTVDHILPRHYGFQLFEIFRIAIDRRNAVGVGVHILCVKEVKRLNGNFTFKDANDWQKGYYTKENDVEKEADTNTAAKRTKHIIAETCENVLLFLKDSVIVVSSD